MPAKGDVGGRRLWDDFKCSIAGYRYGRGNETDFCGTPPPAGEPTDQPPGSPGKLLVLQARAAARVALFHPDDLILDREKISTICRLLPREFAGGGQGGVYRDPFDD
jgi:hypothetical protein